jgi:hypothetical protein
MWFLLSGEGPTDLGQAANQRSYAGTHELVAGPLAKLAATLAEPRLGYDFVASQQVSYVQKAELDAWSKSTRPRGATLLPGAKAPKGSAHFRTNTWALGAIARAVEAELGASAVAIFFRDADTAHGTPAQAWSQKRESMLSGFGLAGFNRGVAMLARPTSEAWLLCALEEPAYQGCEALEAPGGGRKQRLEAVLGERPTRERLNALVDAGTIDATRIEMPSFSAFKRDLDQVLANQAAASPPM